MNDNEFERKSEIWTTDFENESTEMAKILKESEKLDQEIAEFIDFHSQVDVTNPLENTEGVENDDDKVTMSVKLTTNEYMILQSEFPQFGIPQGNDDAYLLNLILKREAILNATQPQPKAVEKEVIEDAVTVSPVQKTDGEVRKAVPYYPAETPKKKTNGWTIAFIVLIVVAVLGLIYWAWKSKQGGTITKTIVGKAAAILNTDGLDI